MSLFACLLVVTLADKLDVLFAWPLLDLKDLAAFRIVFAMVKLTGCDQVIDPILECDSIDFLC